MLSSVNVPTEGLFLRSRFDAIGRMNVLLTNRAAADLSSRVILAILIDAKPCERAAAAAADTVLKISIRIPIDYAAVASIDWLISRS